MSEVEKRHSEPERALEHIVASLDEQIARHEVDIDALKQNIEKLAEQVRTREKAVSRIREARRQLTLVRPTELESEKIALEPLKVPEGFAKRYSERKNGQAWQVRQQAYVILKETGHPLSRAELLEKMTAAGFILDTPRPGHRVGKILWEAKDAFEYRDNGYWIVGEPVTEQVDRGKRFRTRKPRKKKISED
jgi:hypothetical protein